MKFETDEALIAYVTDEVQRVLPEGWVADQRLRDHSLDKLAGHVSLEDIEWHIASVEETIVYPVDPDSPQGRLHECYLVRVSADRRTIIFIHSNKDPRELFRPLKTASLLDVEVLNSMPLGDYVDWVMDAYEPNQQLLIGAERCGEGPGREGLPGGKPSWMGWVLPNPPGAH